MAAAKCSLIVVKVQAILSKAFTIVHSHSGNRCVIISMEYSANVCIAGKVM